MYHTNSQTRTKTPPYVFIRTNYVVCNLGYKDMSFFTYTRDKTGVTLIT